VGKVSRQGGQASVTINPAIVYGNSCAIPILIVTFQRTPGQMSGGDGVEPAMTVLGTQKIVLGTALYIRIAMCSQSTLMRVMLDEYASQCVLAFSCCSLF